MRPRRPACRRKAGRGGVARCRQHAFELPRLIGGVSSDPTDVGTPPSRCRRRSRSRPVPPSIRRLRTRKRPRARTRATARSPRSPAAPTSTRSFEGCEGGEEAVERQRGTGQRLLAGGPRVLLTQLLDGRLELRAIAFISRHLLGLVPLLVELGSRVSSSAGHASVATGTRSPRPARQSAREVRRRRSRCVLARLFTSSPVAMPRWVQTSPDNSAESSRSHSGQRMTYPFLEAST